MAQKELAFAVHSIRVGPYNRDDEKLGDVKGTDVFDVFREALAVVCDSIQVGKQDCRRVSSSNSDDKTRYIWGHLHAGELGERRPIVNTRTESGNPEVDGYVEAHKSVMQSFAYCIYVPREYKVGYIILQQRGLSSNWTLVNEILRAPLLKKGLSLRNKRLAPLDYPKAIAESDLKRITFQIRTDLASVLGIEKMGDLAEIGKITLTIDPHREGRLKSFARKIGENPKGFIESDALEFKAEDARFTMDFNGRQMTLGSDLQAVGRPTFLANIEMDENGPVLESVLAFAKDLCESALSLDETKD